MFHYTSSHLKILSPSFHSFRASIILKGLHTQKIKEQSIGYWTRWDMREVVLTTIVRRDVTYYKRQGAWSILSNALIWNIELRDWNPVTGSDEVVWNNISLNIHLSTSVSSSWFILWNWKSNQRGPHKNE